MGQYYDWVNVDKREYISPLYFDLGNKLWESCHAWNPLLRALYELLDSDWKGDHIVFLGDYSEIPYDTDNPTLKIMLDQYKDSGGKREPFYTYEFQLDYYKDISGLFRDSEIKVRHEIECMVEENDWEFDCFRVDKNDPFKGLFEREGKIFRYTINDTKKEFFDIYETETLGSMPHNLLHILMCYDSGGEPGDWLGDSVRVSDERPDSKYVDISKKQFDW